MSGFRIITADERLAEPKGVKALIVGPAGIGKTSLLRTLDPKRTLFVDCEAGDLAVQDVSVDSIRPADWNEARDLAVFMAGPDLAKRPADPYGAQHYAYACQRFGDPSMLDKYDTYFIDSITEAGRLSFYWSQGQPRAFSEKSGKPDMRGAYGLHGEEMVRWIKHIQHFSRTKNVIFVGGLVQKEDDSGRPRWAPQIDGSKAGDELPYIVDQVITMTSLSYTEKDEAGAIRHRSYRAFVCTNPNDWNYPAKDRSTRLTMIEKPHLGELFGKIAGGRPKPNMIFELPANQEGLQ